jgi:type I restriction enzyme, S subunit
MAKHDKMRTYNPSECAVFMKTKERFGGLSNMAAGFPLFVEGVSIRTSEALYQACRFPHRPDVQAIILAEASPMTAKMRGKPYRQETRPDWISVRVNIMRWCLRVKLAQNFREFSALLNSTGEMAIVEKKVKKTDFWGAKETEDGLLVGQNILGRLLMELRQDVRSLDVADLQTVEPLSVDDFRLMGKKIGVLSHSVNLGKSNVSFDGYKEQLVLYG